MLRVHESNICWDDMCSELSSTVIQWKHTHQHMSHTSQILRRETIDPWWQSQWSAPSLHHDHHDMWHIVSPMRCHFCFTLCFNYNINKLHLLFLTSHLKTAANKRHFAESMDSGTDPRIIRPHPFQTGQNLSTTLIHLLHYESWSGNVR